jgi:hypothetical protein
MNHAQKYLAQANRQIAELAVQVAAQRVIVKHALDTGQGSEMAESLLDALERSIRIFEKHRIFLLSCSVNRPSKRMPGESFRGMEMSEGIMSQEFDGLDATEKAGIEAALNRCRRLAAQIESEFRKKRPDHFVDKLLLADVCASLEHAADVLGQKGRRSVANTPAPTVKGSQARHRQ